MPTWIVALVLGTLTLACGSKKRTEPPAPTPISSDNPSPSSSGSDSRDLSLDGKGLYNTYCASCHGGLEQSSAARATAASIQNAMLNVQEMQSLPELQIEQVDSLATALSKIPPGRAKSKP